MRWLNYQVSRELFKQEYNPQVTDEQLEQMGAGALRKAAKEGDEKNGSFMAGQCAAMVHQEQTAQEMIEEMFVQAEQLLKNSPSYCS